VREKDGRRGSAWKEATFTWDISILIFELHGSTFVIFLKGFS
jgi:hypothetical protein